MAAALPSAACVLLVLLPLSPPPVEAAVPGTFFWNRRMNAAYPELVKPGAPKEIPTINIREVKKPTIYNIKHGYAVIIDRFRLMTTFMAVLKYLNQVHQAYPHLHPCYSDYWTTMYRWMYRYYKMLPDFVLGKSNFVDTHKVWRKRYFYMDRMVPKWIRPYLISMCVHPLTFLKEEIVWKKYLKYIQPHWGKYYIYPSKKFNDYKSMRPLSTVENMDDSTASMST